VRNLADQSVAVVDEDAVLDVPVHRPRQHNILDVTTDARHLLRTEAVIDALNGLLDDRSGIEVGHYVVRGRTDQLHSEGVRLVIRTGPLEAR
jgi:hypothetical protein